MSGSSVSETLESWLESLGLTRYLSMFRDNGVDFDILPEITDADLKEIGISLGDRRRILKSIRALSVENREQTFEDRTSPIESVSSQENQSPGRAERRHLSVMFCDLAGSTSLSEQLDVEVYRELLTHYQDCVRQAVQQYDGYIARYMGDGVLVYFGYPEAHEDDAERSVLAALDVAKLVSNLRTDHQATLSVRVGIASGQVVVGDIVGEGASEERAVLGETPNLAARLQSAADLGTVLISEATRQLVAGRFEFEALGPLTVKGISRPVRAFRPTRVLSTSRFDAATSGGLSDQVGRSTELGLITNRWLRACQGEGQVVMLSGEAGIGKSRMLKAFRDSIADQRHRVVRYQCLPYAAGIAFAPLTEQIQYASGITPDDDPTLRLSKLRQLVSGFAVDSSYAVPLLASLLAIPLDIKQIPEMSPQRLKAETISLLCDRMQELAADAPLLVLVEDFHWIDPSTREYLEALIDRVERVPALLLITHRPGVVEDWERFGHLSRCSLNRLPRNEGAELIAHIAEDRELPSDLVSQILERSDGIPLYIEEITRAILEAEGDRVGNEISPAGNPVSTVIPASVRDSLTARLDKLGAARQVAQTAACIGRQFTTDLLQHAMGRQDIDEPLQRLVESGLVHRRSMPAGSHYLFKHALIQDAAYDSLLNSERRVVHARIAECLAGNADVAPGVVARHYSAAGDPANAARQFYIAGQRALSVSALVEAIEELDLALGQVSLVDESIDRRALELQIRTMLGAVRIAARGWCHDSVSEAYEPAYQLALSLGASAALGPILWGLCVHYWTRADFDSTHVWLDRLVDHAEESTDTELAVVRDMSAGCQYFWEAKYSSASAHTDNLAAIYDAAKHSAITAYTNHDPRTFSLHWAGSLLQWITGFPDRALEMMLEAQELAARVGHPFNSVFALTAGSECLLMRGEFDEAIDCAEKAQAIVTRESLGDFAQKVLVDNWRGRSLVGRGDHEEGFRLTRGATERWREAGGRICSAMFWLGEVAALDGLGRDAEALVLVDACIDHCRTTGDVYMLPEAMRVKAGLLGSRSCERDHDQTTSMLCEAKELASSQKARSLELRVALSLARVYVHREMRAAAKEVLAPVFDQFTEGFDTMDLRNAAMMLHSLQ